MCSSCSAKMLPPLAASKIDGAFVSTGFNDWKDATVSFRKHESGSSECHCAATEIQISIPKQVDVGEQLMSQYRKEKAENHRFLLNIISTMQYLK